MKILAIETSQPDATIALGALERRLDRPADRSLMPGILALCEEEGIALSQIEGVAVDLGPGMFTSLRVGIATAKTLAAALGVTVVGVASLDVLAFETRDQSAEVVARIDAGRGEMYEARYRAVPFERMSEYAIVPAAGEAGVPRAGALLELARERFARGDTRTPHEVEPLYVRRTDAEINWETRGILRPGRVKARGE